MKYHLQVKKTENVRKWVWDLRGKQFPWRQEKRIFGKRSAWARQKHGAEELWFLPGHSEPVFLVVISDAGRFLGTAPSS